MPENAASSAAASFDPDLYKRALDLAARVHGPNAARGKEEQRVPGSGAPYVVHVVKVAMEVLAATEREAGFDRDLAVACALLHDAIEDSEPEVVKEEVRARIREEFGDLVLSGVEALTKDLALPKHERMTDCLRRIQDSPREVWLVKLADRITNLEPPPEEWSLDKRRRYLEEANEILAALGAASDGLRRRFENKLVEYEQYCRG
jgi:guanosine-3',5'-bis(diphosphate) 3'-pyrophosphohydrolase